MTQPDSRIVSLHCAMHSRTDLTFFRLTSSQNTSAIPTKSGTNVIIVCRTPFNPLATEEKASSPASRSFFHRLCFFHAREETRPMAKQAYMI